MNDGDIYRWNYRDPNTDNRAYGSYHCCSRIAVFKEGMLRDTFWNSGSDGRRFRPEDFPNLELTFVAEFFGPRTGQRTPSRLLRQCGYREPKPFQFDARQLLFAQRGRSEPRKDT